MYSFVNDYSEGAHPRVLELLLKSNLEQNIGYGLDTHSDRAREYIKRDSFYIRWNSDELNCDIRFIAPPSMCNSCGYWTY